MTGANSDGAIPSGTAIAGLHVAKKFGHVVALTDASVTVGAGEVVALFGDNGAGKSTLVNTLLGILHPDSGQLYISDREVTPSTVRDTQALGVDCVHQELALAPDLSIVDNMFLGHEVLNKGVRGRLGVVSRREMTERSDTALRELGIKVPSLAVPVRDLSGGQRQAVAVARAVMWAHVAVLMENESRRARRGRRPGVVGECEPLPSADSGYSSSRTTCRGS